MILFNILSRQILLVLFIKKNSWRCKIVKDKIFVRRGGKRIMGCGKIPFYFTSPFFVNYIL